MKSNPYNQDDFCIIFDQNFVFAGVFDGHGSFGHHVSNFITKNLPKIIIANEDFEHNILEAINQGYLKTNSKLLEHCSQPEPPFDCMMSGSTASSLFIRNNIIYIGHTGDSRILVGKLISNKLEPLRVTTDHKPNIPEEFNRILEHGGDIRILHDENIHRIFVKGKEYPGLSTSRAIGDGLAQTVGVSPQPDCKSILIEDNFEYIILGSDGVWEFISDEEALEIVQKYGKNSKKASEMLASEAWDRWIKHEDDLTDDITAIVIHLPSIKNNLN